MSDRRCSACGEQVPVDEDYCPRDGVACFPVVRMLDAVVSGEPSLAEAADYERIEEESLPFVPPEQSTEGWR